MSPVRKNALPGVETLLRVDADHLDAAHDIATIARGLLQSSQAVLLALAIPSDGWGDERGDGRGGGRGTRLPVVIWDNQLRRRRDRIRTLWNTAMYEPVMDALCIAADALFDQLIDARLCDDDVRNLCIVTDGVGVTLSVHAPTTADDSATWLLELAARPERTASILPLSTTGAWALLTAAAPSMRFH